MAYETVMIGSQPYAVYGDVPSAKLYLQADINSLATAWLAADPLIQVRSLVAAVRWLDQQSWVGQPTDLVLPQALQWPRVDVVDQFGQVIDPTLIPANIQFAEFELAAALVDNPDIRAELQNPIAKELRAGSASISFFRPIGAALGGKDVQVLTPFPDNVMDLVGIWLLGSNVSALVRTDGDASLSPFDDPLDFQHGF